MYYTVIQVAALLNINPETVRRWIREEKLHAEQTSKKEGNLISEVDLMKFLYRYPKYNGRMNEGYYHLDPLNSSSACYSYPTSYAYGNDYMQTKLQEVINEISLLSNKIKEYEYAVFELQQLINADRQRIESLMHLKNILERR